MVSQFHEDSGAIGGFRSLKYPVLIAAKRVGEEALARENIERIKQARRKKYSLTCVPLRISREFALCKFQDCMSLIQQMQCGLNLSENSDSIVIQHYLCVSCGLCKLNVDILAAGVVKRIV